MAAGSSSFVKVDELMPHARLEDVCRYYGVALPDLHRIGQETRTRCFLTHCPNAGQTGYRALAIQTEHPAKQWRCHHYGCGQGGSLLSLMDQLAPGTTHNGQPRGARFKQIAQDLQAILGGSPPISPPPATPAAKVAKPRPPELNVPLARSENERARELVNLDAKFLLPGQLELLPQPASAYFRRRPWLTDEVARTFRLGYLPRDAGGDTAGGTQRGKVVYPWLDEAGEVLTWFGRNPSFEVLHEKWTKTDRTDHEPEKFHFVKGFHRGLELWGQHALRTPEALEQIQMQGVGLVLVEGPNDVIRLSLHGVPAVAICSCQITREQALKAAALARQLAGGVVTVMLDLDEPGIQGSKRCLGYLAQLAPVRLAWSPKMYGGKFAGKQPEDLSLEEWNAIRDFLATGHGDWSLD